jgi:hypothetical protein
MIDDSANLPEWVQSKITVAEDYISTVTNYMTAEMSEGVSDKLYQSHQDLRKKSGLPHPDYYKALGKSYDIEDDKERMAHQSELKKKYNVKEEVKDDYSRKVIKYLKKKYQKEDVELQEGRPSQRHPLEGHEYHKKSNAELIGIAKDAHKAAEAMKGHNTQAENKYRDQANDSATVRYFRQKSGMPDWYKKKYGHVKEEVGLDEARFSGLKPRFNRKPTIQHYGDDEKHEPNEIKDPYHKAKAERIKNALEKFRQERFPNLKNEEIKMNESGGDVVFKRGEHHIERYGEDVFALYKNGKKQKNYTTIEAAKSAMKEEVESLEEKNVPTSPEKWAQAKAQAKAKFDVYPSAYANGWAAKKYKEMGGGWKSVSEENISESRKTEIIKKLVKKKNNGDEKFEPDPIMSRMVDEKDR